MLALGNVKDNFTENTVSLIRKFLKTYKGYNHQK